MPATALRHFGEDIGRARAIVDHADRLPNLTPRESMLRSDLLRSAWMLAVGALDAYFCDAYTDIVAATIISKSRQPAVQLPDFFYDIRFPVRAILEPYANNDNWRWRMAARKMMERENILSLETIQRSFNKFFRSNQRFFRYKLPDWIVHPEAKKRLFGITRVAFDDLLPEDRGRFVEGAYDQMRERFASILQRRHDCIHNCDRPKVAPQPLKVTGTVLNVIHDVEFLVRRCDEHIQSEFREFLLGTGGTPTTIAQVGY